MPHLGELWIRTLCWEKLQRYPRLDSCFEGFPALRKIGDIPTLKVIKRCFEPCIKRLETLHVRFLSLEGAYLNFVQCNFRGPLSAPEVEPTLSILELCALRKLVCVGPVPNVDDDDVVPRLTLLAGLPELKELHIYLWLRYDVSAARKQRTYHD